MPIAGHSARIFYRADTTAPTPQTDEIDGIKTFTVDDGRTVIDTTDLKDESGCKTKMMGLGDFTVSMSGDWEGTDTIQNLIRTHFDAGTSGYLTVHFNPSGSAGQKGYRLPVLIEKMSFTPSIDGTTEISISMTGNGAKVAV